MIEKTAGLTLSIIMLLTVAPQFTEARIVWDDGGQHVIAEELDPEVVSVDNSTWLTLSGSVRMENAWTNNREVWEGNLAVVDVLSASQLTVDGGEIRAGMDFVTEAVFVSESTAILDSAKLLGGITAKDSQIDMTAGSVVGFFDHFDDPNHGWNPSVFLESSRATFNSAELSSVIIANDSQLHITAGKVAGFTGNGLYRSMSLDSSSLVASDVEILGGIMLVGRSVGQMLGGSVFSNPKGPATALSLSDESAFELASGVLRADNVESKSTVVLTAGNAHFVMNGGTLAADGFHGITSDGILSDGNSLVEVHDGSLTVQSRGSTLLFAKGSSRMTISGLEAVGRHRPRFFGDNPERHFGYRAAENSQIEISGGSMSGEEPFLDILAEDEGTVTIIGSDFNYPLLTSIEDATGTITGKLRDGKEFSWDFERDPTANIVLVPEPTGVSMVAVAVIVLASLPRERSKSLSRRG